MKVARTKFSGDYRVNSVVISIILTCKIIDQPTIQSPQPIRITGSVYYRLTKLSPVLIEQCT